MIRSRFSQLLAIAALGTSLLATAPVANAENPFERLHRRIAEKIHGGDRDRDCKDKDKDKKKKHKDDDRRHDHDDYDRSRSYAKPACPPQPSYYAPSRDGRDGFYSQPTVRSYSQTLPLEAEVQIALQREGYYRGRIDGELDGETRSAIRDYQEDRGLYPSGRIDRDLLRALRL